VAGYGRVLQPGETLLDQSETSPLGLSLVDGRATISGDIDNATAPRVEEWLTSLDPAALNVDLRGVSFIDSAGLRALVIARRLNPTMRVVDSSAAVGRLLQLTGLVDYLVGVDIASPAE